MSAKSSNDIFPEHRIGVRIGRILPAVNELHAAALKLSDTDSYNLVLHKHLGDVFYAIATREFFESQYNKKLRFIVRPKHAFILDMFGITNFKILDMDKYVLRSETVRNALIDKKDPTSMDEDSVENWLFQAVFSCVPVVGQPFVCENNIHAFFDEELTNGLVSYRLYWAYRWAGNMGVDEAFKFRLPEHEPQLSQHARHALTSLHDLSRVVVFAPDATTASELEPDFWNILADIVSLQGFSIIVNSKKLRIKNTISTFDLGLCLSDVVGLCFRSAYVFALRSGLCDVLASMQGRLYVFYTSMLNREMHGLKYVFDQSPRVNEVEIKNWKIGPVLWRGSNISPKLQKDIDRLRVAHRKVSLKYRVSRMDRLKLEYAKLYYERIAFCPSHIVDNNSQKKEFVAGYPAKPGVVAFKSTSKSN